MSTKICQRSFCVVQTMSCRLKKVYRVTSPGQERSTYCGLLRTHLAQVQKYTNDPLVQTWVADWENVYAATRRMHTVACWVFPTDQTHRVTRRTHTLWLTSLLLTNLQDISCAWKHLYSYKSGSGTKLSCITVLMYHSWEVGSFQEPLPNLWAR